MPARTELHLERPQPPFANWCSRPVADPQTYGKLTLNVELAGAARLHRAASVLMDGLELSGAHI
jgi:hypothetical protein